MGIVKFIGILALMVFPLIANSQQILSLEQSQQLAIEHNLGIRMAAEQIEATHSMSKAAKTGFFPNISANATYLRTNKKFSLLSEDMFIPVIPHTAINPQTGNFNPLLDLQNTFVFDPNTGALLTDSKGRPLFQNYAYLPKEELEFGSKNMYAGAISIMQPVYTGGKIREMYRISQYGNLLAQANKNKMVSEVLFQTEESYWRVVSLQEKVRMVESYIKLLEKLNHDLENLYKEGIIIRNDLLKVQVKINEAQLNLLKAQNGVSLATMALCQVTGLPLTTKISLTDSLSAEVLIIPELAYADSALALRPELEMLAQTVNIAKSGVNLMRSRYLPNIALSANYMLLNPNPYRGFEEEFAGDWNVGFAINIPIFHWNDKAHTLKAARHEQRAAELQLQEARELISLEVQQVIFSTTESAKKVTMAERNLDLAEQNLQVATDAFSEGMVKATDVLEAQALWQQSWSDLIEARMENQLNALNIRRVMGSLSAN